VRAVPHTAFYERNLPWIIARGTGLAALVLLAVLVAFGILTSHPINRTVWRQTKQLIVWHRYLSTFVISLVAVHAAAIILDQYAHVSVVGAILPGSAGYRASAVALGTLALYAMLLTALTASHAQRLPPKVWLYVHRGAILVFALAWTHGLLAGSDSVQMHTFYLLLAGVVVATAATRYWLEIPRPRRAAADGGRRA
jgi:predicted ferric reductase